MRVTTDKSVDTGTLKSLVDSVCTKDMSTQEKATALYNYVNRTMYHYPQRSEQSANSDLDPLRLINTYGYSFCSQQMMTLVSLWKAAGIQGAVYGVPGHCTAQAEYDGKKHWFDTLINGYVFLRDGKTIASLDDIAADPTLLTKAVEEKRVGPGFMACGAVLKDDPIRFCKHDPNYIKECIELKDDITYMVANAGKAEVKDWYPGTSYDPFVTLRHGESVTWMWENLPGEANCRYLKPGQAPAANVVPPSELPPNHFCGIEAEKRDTVNYKYWKPYARDVNGVTTCRWQANGRHVYAPDLSMRPTASDFNVDTFQWVDPKDGAVALQVPGAGKPGVLVFGMRIPEVYTNATLTAEFARAAADDVSRVYFAGARELPAEGDQAWVKVWDAADAKAEAGRVTAVVPLKQALRKRSVWFKLECQTSGEPAKAGLAAVKVEAIFQHNMFARPYLVKGDNKVTVSGKDAAGTVRGGDVTVTYSWQEGKQKKTDVHKVDKLPASYTIKAGGEDELPRMLSIEISR